MVGQAYTLMEKTYPGPKPYKDEFTEMAESQELKDGMHILGKAISKMNGEP